MKVEIRGEGLRTMLFADGVQINGITKLSMEWLPRQLPRVFVELSPTELHIDAETEAKLVEISGRALHERQAETICWRCGHDKSKGLCPMAAPGSGCPK